MVRKIFFPLILLSLTLITPAPGPRAWRLGPAGLELVPSTSNTILVSTAEQADLDGDGQLEKLNISTGGQAAIFSGEILRWHSPTAWQVHQGIIADLNQDGLLEAVLLVWRPFKPWPVDAWLPNTGRIKDFHNQAGLSCHLILIGWFKEQKAFLERWAGSALAEPVLSFAAADLSGNGKQRLVTLDGSYDDPVGVSARQLKVWEWNGFGFSLVSRLDGQFSKLVIAHNRLGQNLILVP